MKDFKFQYKTSEGSYEETRYGRRNLFLWVIHKMKPLHVFFLKISKTENYCYFLEKQPSRYKYHHNYAIIYHFVAYRKTVTQLLLLIKSISARQIWYIFHGLESILASSHFFVFLSSIQSSSWKINKFSSIRNLVEVNIFFWSI